MNYDQISIKGRARVERKTVVKQKSKEIWAVGDCT